MAEAERFGVAMLRPESNSRLSPSDVRAAYLGWCEATVLDPLPIGDIAPALGKLFRTAGIELRDGAAIGVAVTRRQPAS